MRSVIVAGKHDIHRIRRLNPGDEVVDRDLLVHRFQNLLSLFRREHRNVDPG